MQIATILLLAKKSKFFQTILSTLPPKYSLQTLQLASKETLTVGSSSKDQLAAQLQINGLGTIRQETACRNLLEIPRRDNQWACHRGTPRQESHATQISKRLQLRTAIRSRRDGFRIIRPHLKYLKKTRTTSVRSAVRWTC